MPIDYGHDAERNILIVRMYGAVTDDDLVSYAEQAVADSNIDAETNDFVDLTDVMSTSATSNGVSRLDEILMRGGRVRNPGRMAILAVTDVTFGMARMFQAYRDETPIEVQVFRSAEEARRWIGLPPE